MLFFRETPLLCRFNKKHLPEADISEDSLFKLHSSWIFYLIYHKKGGEVKRMKNMDLKGKMKD